MSKKVVILLLVLTLAVIALLIVARPSRTADSASARPADPQQTERERGPILSDERTLSDESASAARSVAGTTVQLRGGIRIGTEDGSAGSGVASYLNGTILLGLGRGSGDVLQQSLQIQNGRWELRTPSETTVYFKHAQFDVHRYTVEPASIVAVSDTEVDLVLRRIRGPTLSVVDGDTKEHLSNVQIRRVAEATESESGLIPGTITSADGGLSSPFRLPPGSGAESLWVGCLGYEWRQLAIVYSEAADRCVPLYRSVPTDVTLGLLPAGSDVRLVIRSHHPSFSSVRNAKPGEIAVNRQVRASVDSPTVSVDLPRGHWAMKILSATSGEALSDDVLFSTVDRVRRNIVVDYEPERHSSGSGVSVNVTLVVDHGNEPVTKCVLRPVGNVRPGTLRAEATPRVAEGGLVNVEFTGITAGTYQFTVMPAGWAEPLVIDESVAEPFFVHVPPPVERQIQFRVRGGDSSSGADASAIMWSASGSDEHQMGATIAPGTVVVKTPQERLDFMVFRRESGIMQEVLGVEVRDATTMVLLDRPTTIRLEISENGGLVPMPRSWWDSAQLLLAGQSVEIPEIAYSTYRGTDFVSAGTYRVPGPGDYEVQLSWIDDVRVLSPARITVRDGEMAVLRVAVALEHCGL